MANCGGHTKKLTVMGVIFIAYCVANIIGSQVFLARSAPNYSTRYNAILGFEVAALLCLCIYGAGCWYENRHRDRTEGPLPPVSDVDMLGDLTDKEKRGFRYIY
ncbi:hypothetical protein PV08_09597 [Exophiala spinifera]|uniref:Amino acid permease/ SLC12A domain-containing protein n=1 Tax=Exophiala spinifera TaxID=91928 RepID=A0A0D2B0U0_9EURO|nr:uncharacterized protein PV08_09597 [Exophiala spinifera]KIW12320.1 hypothetical protein PV08_09597 [Exophiala spinifera]